MAPPKDIARSYPKRGLTADVGFRSEPKFCGDGSTDFDGSADELSTTATLSVATVPIQTFCVWVKPTTVNANRGIVVNGLSNSNDAFYLYQYLTGYGQASNTSSPGQSRNFALNSVKQDQWQFLCGVYDATDPASVSFSLYVDGVSYSDTAPLGTGAISGFFKVGRSSSGYFAGKIANVKVFDVALTQDQVRELYNNPGLTTPTGVNSSNLRRHYKLETNFNDSGADSENLTSVGSPSFTVDRPQLPRGLDLARGAAMARVYTGRGIDLDGSVDYLETTLDSGLGSGFSVSLWFLKRTTTGSNNYLWSSGSAGPGSFTSLSCTSANRLAIYDQASFLNSSLTANLNQWHHAVVTVGTGANSYTVYLDGIGESLANTASPNITNGDFEIGRYSLGSTHYHDGLVSDVKVFDQVLTADQVKELYHYPEQVLPTGVSASNLIHRWALSDYNDTGGTGGRYFQDSAGNNALEDKGSASMEFAQPVPCPQLGLQQSASRIYWDDNTAEKLSATIPALGTDFTIAFWWFSGSSADADVFLEVNTPNLYQLYDDGTQIVYYSSTAGVLYSGALVPEGEWTHIGLTQSGIYKNGVLFPKSGTPVDWLGTAYRFFGRHSASLACNGTCSNMAFWSDALTTAEMLELYNQGPDYDPRNDTGNYASSDTLQNLWFMDDLTTIKDRKGSNDLTVIGSPIMQSFPENASGSTIVGDFSMKRKGVSVLNPALTGSTSLGGTTVACQIPNDGTFDLDASKGFSFSGFLRNERIASTSNLFSTTNYNTASKRFTLGNLGGFLQFRFPDSGGTARSINFSPLTPAEGWHQYAVTMDFASNTVKLFIDGALSVTNTSYTLGTITGVGDIIIGSSRPGGPFAEAAVAAPKFFDVTLSDNEIEQIYRSDLRLIKGLDNE